MRRLLLAASALACAAIIAVTTQLGAQAYWQTTAATSFTVEPASLSISSSVTPATITGASGTAYAVLDLTNDSGASYAVTYHPSRTVNIVAGATGVTVQSAQATTDTTQDCSSVPPLRWQALSDTASTITGGILYAGASTRYCVRITWSGATSLSDGSTVTVNPAVTGAITGTSWTVPTDPISMVSTFTGGPDVTPPSDLLPATCTPLFDGLLLNVTVAGAPVGSYRLRIGAADSTVYYGGASSAAELATPGWTLAMGNFSQPGVTVLFITEYLVF